MVMHSNERGECCPRTLIDRKRKRYDNAVDVVIRLHEPRHLRDPHTFGSVMSHELSIKMSVEGKLHQHDGVMTMMMLYRRRASPKLRDDMTEVEYGGGGHRTRLRNYP